MMPEAITNYPVELKAGEKWTSPDGFITLITTVVRGGSRTVDYSLIYRGKGENYGRQNLNELKNIEIQRGNSLYRVSIVVTRLSNHKPREVYPGDAPHSAIFEIIEYTSSNP